MTYFDYSSFHGHSGPGFELKQIIPRDSWHCCVCSNDKSAKAKDLRYEVRYSWARWNPMCKDCFINHINCMKNLFQSLSDFKDIDELELMHKLNKEFDYKDYLDDLQ